MTALLGKVDRRTTTPMRSDGDCASYRCTDLPSGSGISALPGLLDEEICAGIVAAAETRFFRDSQIGTGRGPARLDRKVRRSKEILLPAQLRLPACRALAKQTRRLQDELDSPIAFATAPLLLRYQTGDFFTAHQDNTRTPGERPFRNERVATYIFYLTSHVDADARGWGFTGGRLFLYSDFNPLAPDDCNPRKFAIVPSAGDLVVFPSSMYHAAEAVSSGARYCLLGWLFASKPPMAGSQAEESEQ
jgi:SM-20-related protein